MLRRLLFVLLVLDAAHASAEVVRLEVTARADVPGYAYERITGRITYRVDPRDPHNRIVADLDKAPRAADGTVTFAGDFVMLRPKANGNGVALLDVVNRGRLTIFGLNRSTAANELGDGFLLARGFTIVAVGWEFDAPRLNGALSLDVPVATDNGAPIAGVVRTSFVPDSAGPAMTLRDVSLYPPVDPRGPDSLLTVRDAQEEKGIAVPRASWQLTGGSLTLAGGFTPGRIYDLSYRSSNPPVGGLGFVAVRDVVAWLKHAEDAPEHASKVYGFGMSQSGRFLRDFLYQGFNTDERGRQAFDAVMIQIAGAGRTDLNGRWATPVSLGTHTATSFPFANSAETDPITGAVDGELDNPRARANQPKVFYTNTGVEYWGGGRAAALLHVSPDGRRDLAIPANVRIYFVAGAQHGPAAFPPSPVTNVQQRQNPTDYWWILRALFVSLDRWAREGQEPPPSAYPTLRDQTLVSAANVSFPAIPGVHSPRAIWGGRRVANPLVPQAGAPGTPLPLLVPQVDSDGNEVAGIRLPEVAVPLATYTGWNFRGAATGGADLIRPLIGSYIPFPATRAERQARNDSRPALTERYASRDAYETRIRAAAAALVRERYILPDDVAAIVARALQHWSVAATAVNDSR